MIAHSFLAQVESDADSLGAGRMEKLRAGLSQPERNTRELQESVVNIRTLSISFSFNRSPRMFHDSSRRKRPRVGRVLAQAVDR